MFSLKAGNGNANIKPRFFVALGMKKLFRLPARLKDYSKTLREKPHESEDFALRYGFLPFLLRGFPGGGSGCLRFKYHCCPTPTTLLVRIYTARPLG